MLFQLKGHFSQAASKISLNNVAPIVLEVSWTEEPRIFVSQMSSNTFISNLTVFFCLSDRAVFVILWHNFSISLLYMLMSASIWCSWFFDSFVYSASFPDILPPSLYVDRIFAHTSLRTNSETSKFESKFVMSSIL